MIKTKEELKDAFMNGMIPSQNDFANLIDSHVGVVGKVADLPSAGASNLGNCYVVGGQYIYECVLIGGVYQWQQQTFNGGSTTNYLNLKNKPTLNGVVVSGAKQVEDYGGLQHFSRLSDATSSDLDGDARLVVEDKDGNVYKVKLSVLKDVLNSL